MQKESADIKSGDALIHCEMFGTENAPILVLLHGNGEDLHIFEPQIRFFSSFYRVVAVDTRGHGQSTRGTAPLDFYTFADDLSAVFNELSIDKAHILGFSDGAIIALHFALSVPERITTMILLGANYRPGGLRFVPYVSIRAVYVWLSVISLLSKKARPRKEIWNLMVHHPRLTLDEISRISVSTLVVTGENDMVRQRHNDEISRSIVGSERVIVPKGDHFFAFKMPDEFNCLALDFLQKNKK